MNKKMGMVVGVIVLALIVGGIYTSKNSKNDVMMGKEQVGKEVMQDKSMNDQKSMIDKDVVDRKELMMNDDAMSNKENTTLGVKNEPKIIAGSYEAYSLEKLSRAESGDVVLFFHASWCPSCRSLNGDIEKNISSIPEGVSILKVDYDKDVDLKKKYGVTYQHTLVQVDKNGGLIKKWSGSPTLTRLVSEIK